MEIIIISGIILLTLLVTWIIDNDKEERKNNKSSSAKALNKNLSEWQHIYKISYTKLDGKTDTYYTIPLSYNKEKNLLYLNKLDIKTIKLKKVGLRAFKPEGINTIERTNLTFKDWMLNEQEQDKESIEVILGKDVDEKEFYLFNKKYSIL